MTSEKIRHKVSILQLTIRQAHQKVLIELLALNRLIAQKCSLLSQTVYLRVVSNFVGDNLSLTSTTSLLIPVPLSPCGVQTVDKENEFHQDIELTFTGGNHLQSSLTLSH